MSDEFLGPQTTFLAEEFDLVEVVLQRARLTIKPRSRRIKGTWHITSRRHRIVKVLCLKL